MQIDRGARIRKFRELRSRDGPTVCCCNEDDDKDLVHQDPPVLHDVNGQQYAEVRYVLRGTAQCPVSATLAP